MGGREGDREGERERGSGTEVCRYSINIPQFTTHESHQLPVRQQLAWQPVWARTAEDTSSPDRSVLLHTAGRGYLVACVYPH